MKKLLLFIFLFIITGQITVLGAYDIQGHWAEGLINDSIQKGYISGYHDGTFKPDSPISRAEFVALANRNMSFASTGTVSFRDVNQSDWFYNDIAIASREGYINGFADNTFRPNASLTREEAAVIGANLLHLNSNLEYASYFTDSGLLTYSKGAVGATVKAKIIAGYTDGEFKPKKALSRAEAVAIINRVAGKKYDTSLDIVGSYQNYYTNRGNYDNYIVADERLNYQSTNLTTTTNLNSDSYYRMFNGNYGDANKTEYFYGSIYYDPDYAGTVKNIYVSEDFNVSSLVSSANGLIMENVTIKGTLSLYSVNKVTLKNCDISKLEFVDSKGIATITTQGDTTVGAAYIYNGVELIEDSPTGAGFREITIDKNCTSSDTIKFSGDCSYIYTSGKKARLILNKGVIENIIITEDGEGNIIEINRDARVKYLDVRKDCYIEGYGRIDHARIAADDAWFDLIPLNLSGTKNPIYTSTAHSGNYIGEDEGNNDLTYHVTIKITNLAGNPLSDVTVRLAQYGALLTNSDGIVTYTGIPRGTYSVTVSKPYIKEQYEDITVRDRALDITIKYDDIMKHLASFTVYLNGMPVEGAKVTLAGNTQYTYTDGKTVFTDMAAGEYTYTVSYDNISETGTVVIGVLNEYITVNLISPAP